MDEKTGKLNPTGRKIVIVLAIVIVLIFLVVTFIRLAFAKGTIPL